MQALRSLGTVVVLAACGCAAHASKASAPPAAPPTPNQRMVSEITAVLLREDHEEAAAIVARARQMPLPEQPSAKLVVYFDATVHAYQGDYRGAAKVMYDHVAKVGPTVQEAFDFHNAMIALRTADGDLLGALVECEEMTRAGALGTWKPSDGDRMMWVRLKEHWHRAYLLRMIAQTLEGAARQVFIGYAESARRDYVALAGPLGTLGDSIAVLEAYFAFCDGAPARMLEAARRVKVSENDDAEDLYLVQLALDGGGEREAAAAVRARILALGSATVMTAIIRGWIRADEAAEQPPRFSPKHPTGARHRA